MFQMNPFLYYLMDNYFPKIKGSPSLADPTTTTFEFGELAKSTVA